MIATAIRSPVAPGRRRRTSTATAPAHARETTWPSRKPPATPRRSSGPNRYARAWRLLARRHERGSSWSRGVRRLRGSSGRAATGRSGFAACTAAEALSPLTLVVGCTAVDERAAAPLAPNCFSMSCRGGDGCGRGAGRSVGGAADMCAGEAATRGGLHERDQLEQRPRREGGHEQHTAAREDPGQSTGIAATTANRGCRDGERDRDRELRQDDRREQLGQPSRPERRAIPDHRRQRQRQEGDCDVDRGLAHHELQPHDETEQRRYDRDQEQDERGQR